MYYHIYNRGNNGENIFIEENNYRSFLQLYDKYITLIAETCAYSRAQSFPFFGSGTRSY